ncbi:hypothetical protein A4A49_66162, partial [Nicotiana attenuata]
YILYDMSKNMFFTNRDVTFREDVFPFQLHSAEASQTVDPFLLNGDHSMPMPTTTPDHDVNVPTTTATACPPTLTSDTNTTIDNTKNDTASGRDFQNVSIPEDAPEIEPPDSEAPIEETPLPRCADTNVPSSPLPSCADTNVPLRRSQRESKEHVWLIDYVTNRNRSSASSVLYPIEEFVTYDRLSSSHQLYLGAFLAIIEPKNFQQASQDQRWVDAM